jgi:outer membrane receptor for ferrienterochelin and colicin
MTVKKIAGLVTVLCWFTSFAQTDTTNLIDLSLEDLLKVTVESATKNSVDQKLAPSVIRVFTKEDFQRFGYTTIQDILMTVPGMQIQEYRAGHQLVWVRGVQARYNNKVLLLIDGVPMRDTYYGNFNIDQMFPLESIEKIEILNGPGSVLYGTNSFAGVINITTRSKGRNIRTNYGTFNTQGISGDADIKGLYANFNYQGSDGFQPMYQTDGIKSPKDQSSKRIFGLLKYNYKNFTVIGGISNYNYAYKYREEKKEDFFLRSPSWGSIKYKAKINDKMNLRFNGFVNYYQFERIKFKYDSDETKNVTEKATEYLNSMLSGTDLDFTYSTSKNELLVGFSWLNEAAMDIHDQYDIAKKASDYGRKPNILDSTMTRNTIGLFAQNQYRFSENIHATAGIRYDVLSAFDNQFNYRIGITGKTNSGVYGKLLYGTAYRTPSLREYVTLGAPNPNLQPEQLKTFEAQVGYGTSKYDISLTYYNNQYSNFIQEIYVDSTFINGVITEIDDEMSFNFKKRNISGLELNATLKPAKGVIVSPNFSLILSNSQTFGTLDPSVFTVDTITINQTSNFFLASATGGLNISYTWNSRITAGLNSQWIGKRNTPANYQLDVDPAVQNKSNANGYMRLDLHTNARIVKGLSIYFKCTNLLDARIYSPPYGAAREFDAQAPGRVIWGGLNYKF